MKRKLLHLIAGTFAAAVVLVVVATLFADPPQPLAPEPVTLADIWRDSLTLEFDEPLGPVPFGLPDSLLADYRLEAGAGPLQGTLELELVDGSVIAGIWYRVRGDDDRLGPALFGQFLTPD